MAFPFLVLARFHHLTGRPGPLTENFSTSGSLLFLLSFIPYLSTLFSRFFLRLTRARPRIAVSFESFFATLRPVRRFIFQGLSLRADESLFNRLSNGPDCIPSVAFGTLLVSLRLAIPYRILLRYILERIVKGRFSPIQPTRYVILLRRRFLSLFSFPFEEKVQRTLSRIKMM